MKISAGGWKVISFAAIFLTGVIIAYQMLRLTPELPIYQPSNLNPKLVDDQLKGKNKDHRIADFRLWNQEGKPITGADLKGRVYVTDFFFTTCPSICPKMTSQLHRVAKEFRENEKFRIVSHTVDPETDSISTLKEYGELNGIDPSQWFLLTGDKKTIYDLARKSYFAVIDEPSQEGPDFIHTENFVLVDQLGQLRGFYDGTDSAEVDQLIQDIRILLESDR